MQGCREGMPVGWGISGLRLGEELSLSFPWRRCLIQGGLGGRGRQGTSPVEPEQHLPCTGTRAWANVGPATSLGTKRPSLALGSRWPRSTRSLSHTLQGPSRGAEGLVGAFWVNTLPALLTPPPAWDSNGGSEALPLREHGKGVGSRLPSCGN